MSEEWIKQFLKDIQFINDDDFREIRDNEPLKCVVRLIVSILNNKITYYGDKGPLACVNDSNPMTFVEVYSQDMETLKRLLEKIEETEKIFQTVEEIRQICAENTSETTIEKYRINNERLQAKNEKLEATVEALRKENKELQLQLSAQRSEDMTNILHMLRTIISSRSDFTRTLDEKERKIRGLNRELATERQAKLDLEKEKDIEIEKLKQQINETEQNQTESAGTKEKEIEDLKNKVTELTNNKLEVEDAKNKEIQKLHDDLANERHDKETLESEKNKLIGEKEEDINKLRNDLKKAQENIEELKEQAEQKINEAKKQFEELQEKSRQTLQEKDDKIRDLENQITETDRAKEDFEKQIKTKIDKLEIDLDEEQKAKKQQEDDFNRQLDDLRSTSNERISSLEQAKEQIENDKNAEIDNLNTQLSTWSNLIKIYKPVLDSMQNCETFNTLLQDNDINGKDEVALFNIAKAIGKNIEFAKEVHNCALKVKQTTNETMTRAEIEVYKALNECYRQIWKIDFDIFALPGGKAVTEEFVKIPFDKNEVVYMKNPREKTNRFTQSVYVPLLKANNGNIHTLAQVQAGNM